MTSTITIWGRRRGDLLPFILVVMKSSIAKTFFIETERCLLRAPSQEDIPHIFSATRFTGFNDGMRWEAPATIEELNQPLQNNLLTWENGTAYTFTIVERHSQAFLGRICIRKDSQMKDVWNVGFWIHPTHQGQGYMTEAAQAVLKFGFTQLNAIRIEAGYVLWNKGSQRVLEKIGMKFLEYKPQGFQKQGQWVETNEMAITKEECLNSGV
jgi:[ribosomal protein S5]-alanine N-acetyltransferase